MEAEYESKYISILLFEELIAKCSEEKGQPIAKLLGMLEAGERHFRFSK